MSINLSVYRKLWLITSLLALISALVGILYSEIYSKVLTAEIIPSVITQDLITIVLAITIIILSLKVKNDDIKNQMIILGLIMYLFYGYGIFVIERIYTILYFVYMIIFSLSFYSTIFYIGEIIPQKYNFLKISDSVRKSSIGILLIIPIIFYPLWFSKLLPLIQQGEKIEFLYSVFILDLCIIFPLFFITANKSIKNESSGVVLTLALFIFGFTLLLPVALGEPVKLLLGLEYDIGGMMFFLFFSVLFLIFFVLNYLKIDILERSSF